MSRKQTAFSSYHPAVALGYFFGCAMIGMTVFQPAFILVFFLLSFLYCAIILGFRAAGKTILIQMPLVLAIAVANPLFSASGSTELVRLGMLVIYQESVLFGGAMGVLLMGIFTSFRNAANVLSSDKVMACFGGLLPTISLMISMVARSMPLFVKRGRMVQRVHAACTAATPPASPISPSSSVSPSESLASSTNSSSSVTKKRRRLSLVRASSVVMEWGMEDSLQTANAMKARGWGVAKRRTSYTRYRFGLHDAVLLVIVVMLFVLSAATAWWAGAAFHFYPELGGWTHPALLIPWVLYLSLPFVLELCERKEDVQCGEVSKLLR